jgi:hypothetical protein
MNPYGQQLPPGLLALIQQAMQRQLQQPAQQPQMPQPANQPMGQQGGQLNPAMQSNPVLAALQQRIMQQKMMGGGLNGMSSGYPTQMPTTGGAGSAGF